MAHGSHRRDLQKTGTYPDSDAIRILDAWWPLLVKGEFQPTVGSTAFKQLTSDVPIDNDPNNEGQHLGSAYDNGFYGFVQKDMRDLLLRKGPKRLRPKVRGPYSRLYCGKGSLAACRTMLLSTLSTAIATPASALYKDADCASAGMTDDQECFDDVGYRAVGVVAQPLQPWINRPTFQQTIELTRHRPR
jgi:hypothetical protein